MSILGVAPFPLMLPHANLFWTAVLTVIIGPIIAFAFSAILVVVQELMPHKIGMVSGLFFGLNHAGQRQPGAQAIDGFDAVCVRHAARHRGADTAHAEDRGAAASYRSAQGCTTLSGGCNNIRNSGCPFYGIIAK